jgi:hypothetical protein
VIVVQDLDRLARGAGDAPGAADHLGELFFALRRQRVTLWSARTGEVDSIRAVLEGERSHSESERKSGATRDGLRRRKDRGAPVGPIPVGYRALPVVVDGEVVTRRVEDPERAPVARRIFEMVADGATFGEVARTLNREGVEPPRSRSRAWEPRAVRRIVENRSYTGTNGYPALIDVPLFERAQTTVRRLDPVAVAARKGGRKSPEEYVLRGIASCARCGATLYTRRYATGRHYICADARQATGLCDAPAVPADVLEAKTLDHLGDFRFDVERWLATRVEEVRAERGTVERGAAEAQQEAMTIARRVEAAHGQYEEALDAGDDALASTALRQVARFEKQQEEALARVREAEARLAEWTAEPDVNAALDFYNGIVDLIEGRVAKARGVAELNVALRDLLAGVLVDTVSTAAAEVARVLPWLDVPETDGDRLVCAQFVVRTPDGPLPEGRVNLPRRYRRVYADPQDGRVTSRPQTLVYRCLAAPRLVVRHGATALRETGGPRERPRPTGRARRPITKRGLPRRVRGGGSDWLA